MKDIYAKFGTKTIHGRLEPDMAYGAVNTPIYQTSTYKQNGLGGHKGFEYSRLGNPSRRALEDNLAAIENGRFGFCFASGMAAIDAVMKTLKPGDEVVASHDLYGGAYRLFTEVYQKLGMNFKFVSMQNAENVESAISSKTKLIWIETPSNPLLQITDIKAITTIAKQNGVIVAADNTFASPYLQNPLDLGVDIVMHSITKYLAGHSDVIMGGLVTNDDSIAQSLSFIQKSCGAIAGPQDCFLVHRGLKTLHVRMQRHVENAEEVAHYLNSHSKVNQVYWPGLKEHPNHEIAKKQMHGFGGMISFTLKNNQMEDCVQFLSSIQLFSLAESLGGVESLASHPASMSHATLPVSEREELGIVESLVRLSVGIEDITDIIKDLEQALAKI